MASAVLLVAVEGAQQARRAFDGLRGEARRAQQGMTADARQAAQARGRAEGDEVREAQRQFRALQQARQRAAREATQAALRSARDRAAAERQATRDMDRAVRDGARAAAAAQREQTRVQRGEAQARRRIEADEVRDAARNARAIFLARRNAEREATAATERERRRRAGAAEQRERGLLRGAGVEGASGLGLAGGALAAGRAVVSYAVSGAEALHEQRQAARATRAQTERTLGGALFQVGADRPDVQRAMGTLTAFAQAHGMNSGDLASAINAAQTEFSSLAPGAGETVQTRLEGMLRSSQRLRNMGMDVGEGLRLQGLFAQAGMDTGAQDFALRYAAGASQRGAIEAGAVTREAMTSVVQRMSQATSRLGPGATPEQRVAAQRAAFMQSFAELEVARSAGLSPRAAGNALASVNGALASTATQERMFTNIASSRELSAAQRTQLGALFATDRGGHHALRAEYQDALRFSESFARIVGDNPGALQNVFRGGGHGNPQALQANWRTVMGAMLTTDASGRAAHERVRDLMSDQTALTENDIARGERVFGGDEQAQLTANEETRNAALTENTSELHAFSDRLAQYMAAHPVEAQFGGTGVSAAHMALNEHSTAESRRSARWWAGGAAFALPWMAPLAAAAGYVGRAVAEGGPATPARGQVAPAHVPEWLAPALERAVASGMLRAAPQMQVTATVNPTDAAHAAAAQPGGNPRPIGQ
jgi:hypothetical protein